MAGITHLRRYVAVSHLICAHIDRAQYVHRNPNITKYPMTELRNIDSKMWNTSSFWFSLLARWDGLCISVACMRLPFFLSMETSVTKLIPFAECRRKLEAFAWHLTNIQMMPDMMTSTHVAYFFGSFFSPSGCPVKYHDCTG